MPRFDELNQLKRFFSTMEISEDEKKKRTDLAYLLYDAIYFTFALIKVEKDIEERNFTKNALVIDQYKETLQHRIEDALEGIPHEDDYVPRLVNDIMETTDRHPDDPYYLSQDRALLIAQNEANTAYNHYDYVNAKAGGKEYKTWVTEGDERVREAHVEVDMKRIPIDDMFHVGNDEMRYPHDFMYGSAENLVNCRCTCIYE